MVTIKGTTTIPGAIRKELNLNPGDKVRFVRNENGRYEIEKALSLEEVRKLNARYTSKKLSFKELDHIIDEGMAKEAARRFKRSSK